jgi:hypothetical protein
MIKHLGKCALRDSRAFCGLYATKLALILVNFLSKVGACVRFIVNPSCSFILGMRVFFLFFLIAFLFPFLFFFFTSLSLHFFLSFISFVRFFRSFLSFVHFFPSFLSFTCFCYFILSFFFWSLLAFFSILPGQTTVHSSRALMILMYCLASLPDPRQ